MTSDASGDTGPSTWPHSSDVQVLTSNRQDLPVDERGLASLAVLTLSGEGVAGGELSLSFVDEKEMADLHATYMGEAGPTDVLSFPMLEDGLLGDVVVCPSQAQRGHPDLEKELRLLVVHGVLHLLGYDHQGKDEERSMWERQSRYLGAPG